MKKKSVTLFFTKFGFYTNLLLSALLVLVYLAAFIPPDSFWPAAFLGFLFPYLLVANLIFALIYLLLKSKKAALSILVLLIGYQPIFNFIQPIPSLGTRTTGIKLLTYNVHYFARDISKKMADQPRILEFLRKTDADIICLQETRLLKAGKLSPAGIQHALRGIRYHHLAHAASSGGPLTLSKFPIVAMGEIRFERSSNMVLFSDIVIRPDDTIRVYNCHFQSYKITPEDYSITDPDKSGTNEQQLREAKLISKKMVLAFTFRARQARAILAHIKKCPYPVIVCGDFNDTPSSYTYHLLGNYLKDSFVEAGFGISNTYRGFLPLFRIDYILHSERFRAVSYQREKIDLSDHYPVTTWLEWLK